MWEAVVSVTIILAYVAYQQAKHWLRLRYAERTLNGRFITKDDEVMELFFLHFNITDERVAKYFSKKIKEIAVESGINLHRAAVKMTSIMS